MASRSPDRRGCASGEETLETLPQAPSAVSTEHPAQPGGGAVPDHSQDEPGERCWLLSLQDSNSPRLRSIGPASSRPTSPPALRVNSPSMLRNQHRSRSKKATPVDVPPD